MIYTDKGMTDDEIKTMKAQANAEESSGIMSKSHARVHILAYECLKRGERIAELERTLSGWKEMAKPLTLLDPDKGLGHD